MSDLSQAANTKAPSSESIQKTWKCLAITLDPGGKRHQKFLDKNNHLKIETFPGVKGVDLSKEDIVIQRLATEELSLSPLLTNGAVGCAASHKAIWDEAAISGNGYLILEDDCYTHPQISDFIKNNLDRLMNIDICFFGVNTDSILQSISPAGLATLSLFDPNYPSPEWIIDTLSKTSVQEVKMHRLIKAFGFCAYFISPRGGRSLSTEIFPLSLTTTNIPLITDKMPAISIDRAGCRIYAHLEAYICQPFLAYTPNNDSTTKE